MIKGAVKTKQQYFDTELDSSSSLKEFSLDRRKYYKRYIERTKVEDEDDNSLASVMGELVETLLWQKEEFDNRFYMSSISKAPTGNMLAFVEALCKHTIASTDGNGAVGKEFSELAELAYKDSGFKWKLDLVLSKFNGSDAEIYYREILKVKSKGLTVVTSDQVNNAEKIVEELRTNEVTAPILNLVNSNRYTVFIQHQIEGFEIDGLKMKAMKDLTIIDHEEKTIQTTDLKVTWSVENFLREYYLYRRAYIQAYTYYEADKELKKNLGLEYYTVKYPQFLVSDSINYFHPLIYTLDSDDITDAYLGFFFEGKRYQGVKGIIADLKWAKENDNWRISRKNYLNGGFINIKE